MVVGRFFRSNLQQNERTHAINAPNRSWGILKIQPISDRIPKGTAKDLALFIHTVYLRHVSRSLLRNKLGLSTPLLHLFPNTQAPVSFCHGRSHLAFTASIRRNMRESQLSFTAIEALPQSHSLPSQFAA